MFLTSAFNHMENDWVFSSFENFSQPFKLQKGPFLNRENLFSVVFFFAIWEKIAILSHSYICM